MRQYEMAFTLDNLHFFMQKLTSAYIGYAADAKLAMQTNGAIREDNVMANLHALVFRVLQAEYLIPSFEMAGVGNKINPIIDAAGFDVSDTSAPKISVPVVFEELLMPRFTGTTLDRFKSQAAWVREKLAVMFDIMLDGITYAEIIDSGMAIHNIEVFLQNRFVSFYSVKIGDADFDVEERVDAYINDALAFTGIPVDKFPVIPTSLVYPTRIGNVCMEYRRTDISQKEAFVAIANHKPTN